MRWLRRVWTWARHLVWRWRRRPLDEHGDPWVEQRTRPGLWVSIADALRKGG